MAEASSNIDPATGAPTEAAQVRGDIYELSPQEAGEVLHELTQSFQQQAPLVPSNAREAAERLAQLTANVEWSRRYMAGDLAARDEFKTLTEMVAAAPDIDAVSQPFQTTIDQDAKRSDVLSAAADLRALWNDSDNCEAAIASVLDPDATVDRDLLQNMRDWKAQALTDPAFVEMLMRGDRWATQRMTLANAVIAIGTEGL
jgi:hypothetical protein